MSRYKYAFLVGVLLPAILSSPMLGADTNAEKERVHEYLKSLSIEDLIEVETRLDDTFDVFDGLIEARRVKVATGEEQSIAEAPAVTSVITAQDIEAMGARDLDEVLRAVPGLHIRYNMQADPIYTLRGIASTNNPEVLLLVNGIRLNNAQEGSTGTIWTGMPVNHIARIEIIRGPGSAVYGADAFAGVINVITKTARDIDGTELGGRYGSFDTRDLWLLHGGRYRGFDVALMLEYAATDGPEEIIEADGQTVYDALFGTSVSEAPGPYQTRNRAHDLRLDIRRGHWQARAGFHRGRDRGVGASPSEALSTASYFEDERFNADLTYHNPVLTQNWDVTLQLSYLRTHWNSFLRLYPPGAFGGAFPDGMIGTPHVGESHTRLDSSGFYSGLQNHLVRLGAGYIYDDQYETGDTSNFADGHAPLVDHTDTPAVFVPEVARDSHYLFVQDTWRFARDWEFTAGLRYDDYSDFGATTNPRGALVWQAQQDFTAKLLYGRAFRAPAFNELYITNNPVQGGNPNLKPEKMDTWELAFDWRAKESLHLALNLFQYEVTNKIIFLPEPDNPAQNTAQNAGHWSGRGLEFELRWKTGPRSSLLLNYAWQDSEDRDSGKTLGNSPAHQAYVRSDWLFYPNWYLDGQLHWSADWSRPPGDPREPVAIAATLDSTLRHKKVRAGAWNFALGIRNLLDEDVRMPSSGPDAQGIINIPGDYPGAGRSYWAEVRYTFK